MPLLLLALHILAYQTVMLCSNAKPYMFLLKLFTVTSIAISLFSMFLLLIKSQSNRYFSFLFKLKVFPGLPTVYTYLNSPKFSTCGIKRVLIGCSHSMSYYIIGSKGSNNPILSKESDRKKHHSVSYFQVLHSTNPINFFFQYILTENQPNV